ncbi:MAG: ABC transporter permease subunit [Chloroflexi bacterium]|nr:ABC transporter permease subunit [Chloroflexota bacterium]
MAIRGSDEDVFVPESRGGAWTQAARRLIHKKVAFTALIVIVLFYGVGILAPWAAPKSYRETPSTDLDLPGFPSLVISPSWKEDQTLYDNTSIGIFRSEDGGDSWLHISRGIGTINVGSLIIAPSSISKAALYAGTTKGVFVSTDEGDSWTEATAGLPSRPNINHLAMSPGFLRDGTLFAALSGGVFVTTNRGASWAQVAEGFQSETPNASYVTLSPSFETDGTVFATVTERKRGSFQTVEEVYKSTDRGQSWRQLFEAPSRSTKGMVLAISPSFGVDGTIYTSTSEGLQRSTDGGQSWELINPDFGSKQLVELVISPAFGSDATLFANTSAKGIFRSTDRGNSWESVSQGLSAKSLTLTISPTYREDRTLFTGTVDNGLFRSTNGGDSWKQIASKDLIKGPSLFQWPPSIDHILGTDRLGRDMLSRIIYGIRTTVIITLASVLTGSLVIGLLLGAAAGFFGGKVDTLIMRIGEIFLAFPGILLIILLAATIKPRVVEWVRDFEGWSGIEGIVRSGAVDYFVVFAALTMFSWVGMARLVRAQILHLKETQYVEAARAMGASNMRIITRHLLPNAMSPIIVSVSMGMGAVAGSEVVLSWFGIGIQPPNPSLGRMILENFGVGNLGILREDPHLILVPAFTIAIIIYAWNLLGDGLNDIMNPRTR